MDDLAEDWETIRLPAGLVWSGRARYAAASSFYSRGMLDAEVLEIYRILSRLDGEDPGLRLSASESGRKWLETMARHAR